MKFWKQLGIFLLLELVMYVATVCACEDFYIQRQQFNSRLIGYTTANYSDIGFLECVINYLLLPECKSLNYNFELSACELNTKNSSNVPQSNLSKEAVWVFSDASVWPEEMAGTCADLPCGKNRMCLPTTPTFTCILDCGEFPVYPNAILKSVSAAEKTFQCDENAIKVYNSTIKCSEDEDGNIVWQPKENATLCKVVNQSRCENHGNCENNGGNCNGDTCVCQNGTCIARFILSSWEHLGSSPDTGLLYIWHNDSYYGLENRWRWWNWKMAIVACQLINPKYRFGGTYHLQPVADTFVVYLECSDGTLSLTACTLGLRLGGCSNSCAGGPGGPVLVGAIDCPEDVPHVLFCHSLGWNAFVDEDCIHYEIGLDCQ